MQPPDGVAQQRIPRAEGRPPDEQGRAAEVDEDDGRTG